MASADVVAPWSAYGRDMPGSLRVFVVAVVLSVGSAASAQANTVLHVDSAHGNDVGDCQTNACKTLTYAVPQGRLASGTVTIEAAAGIYTEDLSLVAADSGLTIAGAGSGSGPANSTILTGVSGNPTIATISTSSLSLEHLRIVNPGADAAAAISTNATNLQTGDVAIDVQGNGDGIDAIGTTTISGGSITLEGSGIGISSNGALTLSGTPVSANGNAPAISANGPLTMSSSPVTLTNPSGGARAVIANGGRATIDSSPIDVKGTGGGIVAVFPLTLTNSPITLENATGTAPAVAGSGPNGALTITGGTIDIQGTAGAVSTNGAPASLTHVKVTLENPADHFTAISANGLGSSLSNVSVSGAWDGAAISGIGSIAVTDSSLRSSVATGSVLATFGDGSALGYGDTVSIQRTTFAANPGSVPVILANNVNIAVDSSALLGGGGLYFGAAGAQPRTLTVVSSTIDTETLGTRDAAPARSVSASTDNMLGSVALVNVEGSILVEPPAALQGGATSPATVNCSFTEVPGTTQLAGGANGAINCGTGASGNTSTASLSSIFANPGSDYSLNPAWSGVDSVPESAISLPGQFTASATDLLGNPRALNASGTCLPGVRDKGAIELTGHGGVVPAPAISGPASVYTTAAASFAGSVPNVPEGTPLSFAWRSSDGATGSGKSFSHRFARAGRYTVSVTVTGAAGCTASASKSVSAHGVDVISKLTLSPPTFRAAPSGGSVIDLRTRTYGTVISYRGTESATTTFTIQRPTQGRMQGKACRKPSATNRRNKHCTLYLAVGSFTRTDLPGTIRLRFSGRVKGHKLPAGRYRVQIVASNRAGHSRPAYATFTITR